MARKLTRQSFRAAVMAASVAFASNRRVVPRLVERVGKRLGRRVMARLDARRSVLDPGSVDPR